MIKNKGFTLVELLVVMAIISVLATVIISGFRSSQMRGRDGVRKSDLKQIANSLELFYSDYGRYPAASKGEIAACPFDSVSKTGTACSFGKTGSSSEFTDGKTIYFKALPKDPVSAQDYVYVVNSTYTKFQLFAKLENSKDKNIMPGITTTCGSALICNYSATSTNTTPTEILSPYSGEVY
jgi:prepilin-type N-terminal cleavage/methylation domain-containing protein